MNFDSLKKRIRLWRAERYACMAEKEESYLLQIANDAKKAARTWQRRKYEARCTLAKLREPIALETPLSAYDRFQRDNIL